MGRAEEKKWSGIRVFVGWSVCLGRFLFSFSVENRKAIALFSYSASYDDELSFDQGDILLVTGLTSIEEGWFEAEKEGRSGIVPGNYLEFVSNHTPISPLGMGMSSDSNISSVPQQNKVRMCGMDFASYCTIS